MSGDKPWRLADQKTISLLYLSIAFEGRRVLKSKNTDIMLDTLSTAEIWRIVEEAFIGSQNITIDRYVFLITKQIGPQYLSFSMEKLKN